MSPIRIAAVVVGVTAIAVILVAHQKDRLSKKSLSLIDRGCALVLVLCAVVSLPWLDQQPSTMGSNAAAITDTQLPSAATVPVGEPKATSAQAIPVVAQEPAKPRTDSVQLTEGKTRPLFDGQLRVSLDKINYEGNPPYWKFYGQIEGPGLKALPIKGASPGFTVKYGNYEITLSDIDAMDASVTAIEISLGNSK